MKLILIILAFIFSAISFTISVFEFKAVETNAVDYIGVIGSMVAISVTVLVGFQIYRAYEVKKDLNEFRNTIQDLLNLKSSLQKFELESRGTFHMIVAGIQAKEQSGCTDSFLNSLKSIEYFLKCDYDKIDSALDDLKESILSIQPGYLKLGTKKESDRNIDEIIKIAGDIENIINQIPNFYIIKRRFDKIMKAFYFRMDNCRNLVTVTSDEHINISQI